MPVMTMALLYVYRYYENVQLFLVCGPSDITYECRIVQLKRNLKKKPIVVI